MLYLVVSTFPQTVEDQLSTDAAIFKSRGKMVKNDNIAISIPPFDCYDDSNAILRKQIASICCGSFPNQWTFHFPPQPIVARRGAVVKQLVSRTFSHCEVVPGGTNAHCANMQSQCEMSSSSGTTDCETKYKDGYRTGYLKDDYPSSSGSGFGSSSGSSSGSSDVSTQYTSIVVTAINDETANFINDDNYTSISIDSGISGATCSTVPRNYRVLFTKTYLDQANSPGTFLINNAGIGNRVTQAGNEGTLSTAVAAGVDKIYINVDNDQSFDGATELCIKNVVNVWTLSISPERMTHPVGTQVTQRMTHADSASGTLKVCSFHI